MKLKTITKALKNNEDLKQKFEDWLTWQASHSNCRCQTDDDLDRWEAIYDEVTLESPEANGTMNTYGSVINLKSARFDKPP